jgi:hypothetical protein
MHPPPLLGCASKAASFDSGLVELGPSFDRGRFARLRILEQEQCLLARRTVPKINQGREPGEGTTSKRPADACGSGTVYWFEAHDGDAVLERS